MRKVIPNKCCLHTNLNSGFSAVPASLPDAQVSFPAFLTHCSCNKREVPLLAGRLSGCCAEPWWAVCDPCVSLCAQGSSSTQQCSQGSPRPSTWPGQSSTGSGWPAATWAPRPRTRRCSRWLMPWPRLSMKMPSPRPEAAAGGQEGAGSPAELSPVHPSLSHPGLMLWICCYCCGRLLRSRIAVQTFVLLRLGCTNTDFVVPELFGVCPNKLCTGSLVPNP